jgi:hypothetical protein
MRTAWLMRQRWKRGPEQEAESPRRPQGFNRRTWQQKFNGEKGLTRVLATGLLVGGLTTSASAASPDFIEFAMVPSAAATGAGCLQDAKAQVKVTALGPVEQMDVNVSGLPPNTEFDFFVIQLPNAPFGLAWYQGDIETNGRGKASQRFIGRFNLETFIVAQPPSGPAPVVHNQPPFPDASTNPTTEPVHTFHLGLWFNSPEDAAKAGCPNTVTRFNGDHNAGIQVLSTHNFPDLEGPLQQLEP